MQQGSILVPHVSLLRHGFFPTPEKSGCPTLAKQGWDQKKRRRHPGVCLHLVSENRKIPDSRSPNARAASTSCGQPRLHLRDFVTPANRVKSGTASGAESPLRSPLLRALKTVKVALGNVLTRTFFACVFCCASRQFGPASPAASTTQNPVNSHLFNDRPFVLGMPVRAAL